MQPDKSAGERALAAMSEAQSFASEHLKDTKSSLELSCRHLKLIIDNKFYHEGVRSRAVMIYEYLQKEISIFGTQGGPG